MWDLFKSGTQTDRRDKMANNKIGPILMKLKLKEKGIDLNKSH